MRAREELEVHALRRDPGRDHLAVKRRRTEVEVVVVVTSRVDPDGAEVAQRLAVLLLTCE